MERYLLQFIFVIVAYSIGGLLVNAWLNELFSKRIEIEIPPNIEIETAKLTFDCGCDVMQIAQNPDGVLGGKCIGSDGSQIFVGWYADTWSKDSANRAFEKQVKSALKVASIAPIINNQGTKIGKRALIKTKETVKIVELLKSNEKQFYRPYVVSIIEAADFKHAIAYENQKKEISRNIRAVSF